MLWRDLAWNWLVHAALGGFVVLGVGCLAVRSCRQPARRLRLIALALAGCLLVSVLNQLPVLAWWRAGVLPPASATADVPAPAPRSPLRAIGPPASVAISPPPERMAPGPFSGAIEPLDATVPTAILTPPADPARLIRNVLIAAYAITALGLFAAWLAGHGVLWRLCRSAAPAAPEVAERFRAIAGPRGDRVRLLVSGRIGTPLTFTWRRPVILLPAELCRDADAPALRYSLAHEWSHVERGDAWAWNLASVVQWLAFYQPAYWWLRRQLRLCQDYLADARAAEQATAAEDYADFLLAMARARLAWNRPALPALGIVDQRSNLSRRVLMLVQRRWPLERRCWAPWSIAATAAALGVVVAVSGLRLDAAPADEKPKEDSGAKAAKDVEKAPKDKAMTGETLHYSGIVLDKDTHAPIAGATVTVRRSILRSDENRVLEESKHTTDAAGRYEFTIPPEQSSISALYIELDVEHSDYAPQMGFGYALSMIRKNEKLGGRPFFEKVELRRGQAVTGRVETPDGQPAAGVDVLGFSLPPTEPRGSFEYGSFAKAKTDADGRFRIVPTTPGRAVFWLLPKDYAPSLHALKDNKRGDVGRFVLEKGIVLKGKMLDTEGKPLAGLFVHANRDMRRAGEEDVLQGMHVADMIRRTAETAADGSFAFDPLPPGDYTVKPEDHGETGRTVRPLPTVFLPQKVTLKEGETPEPIEVRAAPYVIVEAQYFDSKGQPTRGHSCFIFGRIDGGSWHAQARPDIHGKIVARVPHGLENAQLDLMTNEHGALRHRLGKDKPLENNRQVNLGTLDHDVKGIEIIRYVAPIVLVKVATPQGDKPKGARVSAVYPEGKGQYSGRLILKGGENSDVSFEEQEDGRFRSEQLFPDQEVTITAKADGYEPRSETLKLPEGASKDLELVLKEKTGDEGKGKVESDGKDQE